MTLLRCIILLQFGAALALGQASKQSKPGNLSKPPEALVRSLYQEVVALHPLGVSVGGHLKVFAPYLSKALLQRINVANACVDDWYQQNPDPSSKPPGLEDGLFTGDDERAEPRAFDIEKSQSEKDGSIRVYVKLTRDEPGESPWLWRVAAVVVRDNGSFVVDDVIWLKDHPQDADVRLSEYLSQGCDGAHWVGYRDLQNHPKK
jgi:hypothetical protein